MYTGAPEKCLEVVALTKKSQNSPFKTVFKYTPANKTEKKTCNILIINNYNFTIF